MILQFWQPALFAFVVALLLVVAALRLFPKWGLIDRPQRYGLNRGPIPYYGGLMVFVAFVIAVFVFVPLTQQVTGLLIGALLIVLIGFLDDLFGLSPWLRLAVQFLAALVLVFSGIGILSINLPVFGKLDFTGVMWGAVPVLGAVFTIVWVMAIVNTMNFVDGVSGLSSGVSFIAGVTLFLLSIHPQLHANPSSQVGVATIALILAMVSLAFLLFDFPSPKILLGDTGSTFFGFVIATLAIFSGGKVATAFLVLGIPILDMVWVVLRRLMSGQKFWHGDLKHLHHRLLVLGLSERKVISLYLLITAFFGFTAVLMVSSLQKLYMLIGLVVLMLLLGSALVLIPGRKR